MEDIRRILKVNMESPFWDESYKKALAEPEVPRWLDGKFLTQMQREKNFLTKVYDRMAAAADAVLQVKELVLLVKTLKNIIAYENPENFGYHDAYIVRPYTEAFTAFELPKAPEGTDPLAYESVCVFPIVAHLVNWIELMEARGVDEDVIRKTTDYWCGAVAGDLTVPISVGLFQNYSSCIYRDELFISPMRFQLCPSYPYRIKVFANEDNDVVIMADDTKMHRSGHTWGPWKLSDEEGAYYAKVTEDETHYEGNAINQDTYLCESHTTRLPKSDWHLVYKSGDALVRIHLAGSAGFKRDLCENAINRAKEIFARCFPEYDFKGVTGYAWFMGPELIPVLKPESNLYQFRQMFHAFPSAAGAKDSMQYIFGIHGKEPWEVDIDGLPEDNSLRPGVKEQMKKGNYIRNHGGFILFK